MDTVEISSAANGDRRDARNQMTSHHLDVAARIEMKG
jgi:hypothetical protein